MTGLSPLGVAFVLTGFGSCVLGGGIAYVAWQRRETTGAKRFVPYVLSVSVWILSSCLLWLSPPSIAIVFDTIANALSVVTLVFWIHFVVEYTGRSEWFTGWKRRVFLAWAGGSLLVICSVLLPELPVKLQYRAWEPTQFEGLTLIAGELTTFAQLNAIVPLTALVWSFVVLKRFASASIPGQRRQALAILLGALSPTVASAGYYLGDVSFHPALDPTPLFFITTVLIAAVGLLYYDFLDVEPIATTELFETMNDPVIVVDDDDEVVTANDAATDLRIEPGDRPESMPSDLVDVLDDDEGKVQLTPQDGDGRVFDPSVSTVIDARGDVRGRLLVLRDVTELERQNERLDQFASVVSHDLRNPLNVASGHLDLVAETGNVEHVDEVQVSLDRMEAIIDDLLTMARADEAVESTTPISVSSLVHDAWSQVDTNGADLTVEASDSLTIEGDRNQLLHVFENLFRNAVEHNDSPLTIRIEPIENGDGVDGLAVEDDGSGIPPDRRDEVFEHGYTTSHDGTGFGLSIVDDVVDAHGWSIDVTEGEDGGARFEVTDIDPT